MSQMRHTPVFCRRPARFLGGMALLCYAWLTSPQPVFARTPVASSPTHPSVASLNPAAVTAFADAEIPAAMRAGKIPGAVFVVVQNDQVICEKAYGVSDLQTRKPVLTDATRFRVASVSKIFTTATALELVQANKLSLHRNVNDYLTQLHIAPTFGQPVTLFNLLTHSSGFDEWESGYAAHSAAGRLSLRHYLTQYQPARVRPPGRVSVYDNYGFALAGYLIQKVSGVPFAACVEKNIFAPLDMTHSDFLPDAAERRQTATGYWLDGETPRACAWSFINITPAAGLCTTASDMANFLVALLANRTPEGAPFLAGSVIHGLETEQFASAPDVPGRCFGFNCITLAGRSALRQSGQWSGFNSVLMLFPKDHCGIFLAYNLCDYGQLAQLITRRFTEKFISPDLSADSAANHSSVSASTLQPLLGAYLSLRGAHAAPEWVFPDEITVAATPEGNLEINGQMYREIKPLVFERIETNPAGLALPGRRVAFLTGNNGTRLITQSGAFQQTSWAKSAKGRTDTLLALTMIFISAVVLWPILLLIRPGRSQSLPAAGIQNSEAWEHFTHIAKATALAACLLALWFEGSFALAEMRLPPFASFYGQPISLLHLFWTLPVLVVLSLTLLAFSVIAWCKRLWHPAKRVHYTLVTLALGMFLYTFYERHLLFVG